jgi:inorganic triphosphatase YgiF
MPEIEIKLQVPAASRDAVARALHRGRVSRLRLAAQYFDTPDRRLAAAGLVLRLRREGRQWVQAVKGAGDGPLQRLEHEARIAGSSSRDAPALDLARHDGTPEGRALRRALGDEGAAALALQFQTDVQRTRREVRLGATRIELALDEGVLRAGDERTLPVCELEFELLQGPLAPMVALASRWAARHGLWFDARSKAERGQWLADGSGEAPVAKAKLPTIRRHAAADAALREGVRCALSQLVANASWLAAGSTQAEHVHQARVGLRRLRSLLREFGDWSEEVDARWLETAREVFGQLSAARDRDALAQWLWPTLHEAGAPPFTIEAAADAVDPGTVLRAATTTQWLLEMLAFAHGPAADASNARRADLRDLARAPLAKLHRQVQRAGRTFDTLDDQARHRARKRLKRLRYAAEAMSSLWPVASWAAYLPRLRDAQDALGRLQDVMVAEPMLRDAATREPGAAFGLGYIAARRGAFVADAGRALAAIGGLPAFLR